MAFLLNYNKQSCENGNYKEIEKLFDSFVATSLSYWLRGVEGHSVN